MPTALRGHGTAYASSRGHDSQFPYSTVKAYHTLPVATHGPSVMDRREHPRNPPLRTTANLRVSCTIPAAPDYCACRLFAGAPSRVRRHCDRNPPPLPETVVHLTVWLPVFHASQKCWGVSLDKQQGSLRDRLLDRFENVTDVINQVCRPDQEMSMFRHDNISPHMEAKFTAGSINRLGQPFTTSVLAQEWLPPKAGKSQGMGFAGIVVSFAGFSIRHG